MRIINLIEDTEGKEGLLFEHGLCFYVEVGRRRILVDTGASDAFITNAKRLGIDLTAVDTAIISHGHYDHAGGVMAFAELNREAKIYIHKNAVGEFYNLKNGGTKYIGMDKRIVGLEQVCFVDGDFDIDGTVLVFSDVSGKRLLPRGNTVLRCKCGDGFPIDSFDHEQYAVICEGGRRVLISGCAHRGIVNILEAFRDRFGGVPTEVISGFHTVMTEYGDEDNAIIDATAKYLAALPTRFYSGHCTGEHALSRMKAIMGDKLTVLHSGDVII